MGIEGGGARCMLIGGKVVHGMTDWPVHAVYSTGL